ncbi:MAG: homocitrate synthase family protein [Methanohalobium sp.]|uniref:homocitrate synthase family protein n=1 Tax=Methanohalobium sp. TaxID=2837493 RepID=UPI00397E5A22
MSEIEENSYSRNKLIDYLSLNPIDVEICDVTLRDGEQTPGVVFTKEEKMNISNELDSIGVDIIETGFPVVSSDEKDTIKQISNMGLNSRTCCLSRALSSDVDSALDCDVDMVSIFVAISDLHLIHKYQKSCEEMISCALDTIEYAKDHGLEVRFAAEDASRTDIETLKNVFLRAQDYRVDYVSLADTVGILNPSTTYYLVDEINKSVDTPICIHCHNDLGMATANTLMAAEAGAKQLHTTVNGIGERAGNAALEEVLMGLMVEYNIMRYDTTVLTELSRTVENYANITPPVNKAIIGKNAFSHESGIHVMAILENPRTYELFNPELVGGKRNLIVGKHTGIKALKGIINSMGYSMEHDELCRLKNKVKNCTDIKHGISRERLEDMVRDIKMHDL